MTEDLSGGRVGKRAEAREKKRKQRQRLVYAGASAFVVLLVLVTVVLVKNGGSDSKKPTAKVRTQKTLLLQVKGADGGAISSALLADDRATNAGAVVLIQPGVMATVPGIGSLQFSQSLLTGGVTNSRDALSDLMSVTIDGSWVMDSATFSHLIDLVGGLTVTVDANVIKGRQIVIASGSQHLSGSLAVEYATYLGDGEVEQIRLARLQTVLDALISALPANATTLIGSLGGGSMVTQSNTVVAGVLAGLEKDDKADNLQYQSLPVTKIDVGDDTQRFNIDATATRALVDSYFPTSIPPGARKTGNRVLVLNGVGTPGLGEKVRAKLVKAGFVYVGSRNAPHFGFTQTQVLVPTATEASGALGNSVARALGVPLSSVKASDSFGTIADVVVIVGNDFVPGK